MKKNKPRKSSGKFSDRMLSSAKDIKAFWQKAINLPRLNLTDRQLFDLELILTGGFHPLNGFLNHSDYESVVENMKLSNGELWPMPIVLDVASDHTYKLNDEIILCDKYGNPIASFKVESIYKPDKVKEAKLVFGTNDLLHPGVKYLMESTKDVYLGGKVSGISLSPKYDFKELRKTPKELRDFFKKKGWKKVIAFQTRNPIHRAHFDLIKRAVDENKAKALIHPVVGLTKEGDIDYITRVRAYKSLHSGRAKDFAELALLPLAMRMAGPREAIWHALIRKNHGCTHFIIGRDHAGPGNDSTGKPFYGPYEAQELAKKYENEIGIKLLTSEELSYVEEIKGYLRASEIKPGQTVKNISGTNFRRMLLNNEEIPEWFSFPEVINELRIGAQKSAVKGTVIFFTGLSGSGKSTIANILATKLLEIQNKKITVLDGDVVRQNLSKGLGFSKEDRNTNVRRIGFVAGEVARHGGIAICAAIAPYSESRDQNRQSISREGNYVEVFVSTPLSVCKKRDVKGLYKQAKHGKIKGLTGLDDPYEVPVNPEIVINTTKYKAEQCATQIIEFLKSRKYID